jgi:predicted permease
VFRTVAIALIAEGRQILARIGLGCLAVVWQGRTVDRVLAEAVLSIRQLGLPLAAWLLSHLFHLDATQTTVLLAFSSMPTATSAYVLASRMGYDGSFVAGLVTLSTLLGMLSLPFALGLLRHL